VCRARGDKRTLLSTVVFQKALPSLSELFIFFATKNCLGGLVRQVFRLAVWKGNRNDRERRMSWTKKRGANGKNEEDFKNEDTSCKALETVSRSTITCKRKGRGRQEGVFVRPRYSYFFFRPFFLFSWSRGPLIESSYPPTPGNPPLTKTPNYHQTRLIRVLCVFFYLFSYACRCLGTNLSRSIWLHPEHYEYHA
jgi:hypothetical protein